MVIIYIAIYLTVGGACAAIADDRLPVKPYMISGEDFHTADRWARRFGIAVLWPIFAPIAVGYLIGKRVKIEGCAKD